MTNIFLKALPLSVVLCLSTTNLMAQDVTGNNLTLSGTITQNGSGMNFFDANNNTFAGRACIGISCDGTEPFEQGPLRLKWSEPDIYFHDSSSTPGISSNDWRLVVNTSTFTHFSIQDVDGGTIPFTVEGGVPDSTLWLATGGNVGIGTDNPGAPLTVSSPGTFNFFRIEALGAGPNPSADMTFTGGPNGTGEYRINVVDGDGPEMRVNAEGYVIATTGFKVGGTTLNVPDYVFEPSYQLRPLSEVDAFIKENRHLPEIPSAKDIATDGLDMTDMQLALLRKVEELTLYTLEQERTINALNARLQAVEAR